MLEAERFRLLDGLCATWLSIQQTQSPEAFQGRGLVVPEAQVTLALSGEIPVEPFEGFLEAFDALREKEASAADALSILLRRLGCSRLGELAVLLAAAPDKNRKYERVFAYLQDDLAEKHATVGLCADLYALVEPVDDAALFALTDRASPLNRFVLVGEGDGLRRRLELRETALLALSGAKHLPASLAAFSSVDDGSQPVVPVIRQAACARAARFLEHFADDVPARTGLLMLCGAEGSGRKFLLRSAAAETGRPVLFLDSRALAALPPDEREEIIDEALSWAFLNRGVPALCHFDFEEYPESERRALALSILRRAAGAVPALAVCCEKPPRLPDEGFQPLQIDLSACTIGEQRALWTAFLARAPLPPAADLDAPALASVYSMTPGQIRLSLDAAETDALSRGETQIGRQAVSQGVRILCRPRLSRLAEPLTSGFGWDDLMLGEEQLCSLRELCDRIRLRWKVNEDWGFDRKLPYRKGVSVCLYGPPGTGKTMTAQVLAREFGLDAYRIDMSRVMDKYIGETEKKLAELFDAARDCNAVLFFDEADALFAKRSEVTDAKDKYANAETAYLLQRMEQHNGVSILATNAVQNFDEAFKRRISFMVNLPMPDEATRRRIWHSVFPPEAPLQDVDLDFFAARFELSGSSIKSIAVASAFLAAAEGTDITRETISRALREEYRKTGRVLMESQLY